MMAGTHDDAHVVSQLWRERIVFIETAQALTVMRPVVLTAAQLISQST
jgi:hypothetical protein